MSCRFSERPYLRKTPRVCAWPPHICSHTHFFSSSGRCHSRLSFALLGVCHTAWVSFVIWMVSFAEIRQLHWQTAAQGTFNLACSNPSPGLPGHRPWFPVGLQNKARLSFEDTGLVGLGLYPPPYTPVTSVPAALALLLVSFCHGAFVHALSAGMSLLNLITWSPPSILGWKLRQTKAPQPGRTK